MKPMAALGTGTPLANISLAQCLVSVVRFTSLIPEDDEVKFPPFSMSW